MVKAFGLIFLLGFAGIVNTDLMGFLGVATRIAGAHGIGNSGTMPLGDGRTISWSYKGMLVDFDRKYMGVCTDSKTGQTETFFTESSGGAVENCITNLIQRLHSRDEL